MTTLLESPSRLLSTLCASEREILEERQDIHPEHFIEPLLTTHTREVFSNWYAENSEMDIVDMELERRRNDGANISAEGRRQAYLDYLSMPLILPIEFTATYMDYGDKRVLHAPPPDVPANNSQTIRDIFRKHVAAQASWPDEHLRRAYICKNLDHLDLFPSYSWQEQFRNQLFADIRNEKNLDARLASLQVLLGGESLKDPSARQEAARLWTLTLLEKQTNAGLGVEGKDDGDPAYQQALMPSIEWAETHVPIAERYRLFIDLASMLESQRSLSYRLRDSFRLSGEDLERSDKYFRVGEAILVFATHQRNGRQILLDYLMREPTEESREQFGAWLLKERKKYKDSDSRDEIYLENFAEAIDLTEDKGYYSMQAQNFYNNFWQAPLPARVGIMDQLLMTPDEKDYTNGASGGLARKEKQKSNKAYNRAFGYVAEKLLPAEMQYAKEARIALETYKDILPPNERALFLSAMLGASDAARQSGGALSVGERLAIVLEMMGPATVKFGQALSNYPDAPMNLRKPMVRLTKNAAPSARWDLWSRYDDVVPLSYRQGVQRMGPVRGSGSYQESVRLEKTDGTRSVLKLQRPHVERRADAGFQQLRDFVQELQRKEASIGKEIAEATDGIVHQAQKMAEKETDALYRLRQVQQAEDYYNPLEIAVGGFTFRFQTAGWLAYGVDREDIPNRTDRKEWCDEVEMPGVHFDELPETTAPEKAYKKAVAKATVAAELAILLSGRPIDHDRHAAQLRVDTATDCIGLFDHGALDLEPPAREEKEALAKVLASVTQSYQAGVSLPEIFYTQLQKIKADKGYVPEYLIKVERGVLAMTPFFEQMTGNDLKDVLAAVHEAGLIDQDMLNAMIKANIPVLGERNIKLSTALEYALPAKSGMHIDMHPVSRSREPVRFDYSHRKQEAHPQFPGIRANGNGLANGTSGSATDDSKHSPDATLLYNPVATGGRARWKSGVEDRALQ